MADPCPSNESSADADVESKSSRFFDLPTEIRLLIYESLEVTTKHVIYDNMSFATVVKVIPTDILATCRKANLEATNIIAKLVDEASSQPPKFIFDREMPRGLQELHSPRIDTVPDWLAKASIHISHDGLEHKFSPKKHNKVDIALTDVNRLNRGPEETIPQYPERDTLRKITVYAEEVDRIFNRYLQPTSRFEYLIRLVPHLVPDLAKNAPRRSEWQWSTMGYTLYHCISEEFREGPAVDVQEWNNSWAAAAE